MPAIATRNATEALSVSKNLPDGCLAFRHGLQLPANLTYEDWRKIGTQISDISGAAMWMLGDWLAFGQDHYLDTQGSSRVANETYAKVAAETGFSEGALRNAKWTCSKMPLSQRRDKLTFGHAQEIVGRTTPNQFPFWVNQIETKGLSIKALREELRKASSTYKPETNDGGTSSFLEIATQFSRDYLTACPAWSPKFRAEVLNILSPVLKEMGVRG